MIQISAIICTHNRAEYLSKAVDSLGNQTLNQQLYEILVVDNASTDNTKAYVSKERGVTLNLRYIYEPIPGLNHARNAGWRNARGDFVAYLDDDAIASPTWLETIVNVFNTVIPTPGCVGGRVDPVWGSPPPSWLSDQLIGYLAVVNWSAKPIVLDETRYIAGVNMAFPKHLLAQVGGFQTGIDRVGAKLLSNGDILVERLIRAKGYDCFYHPEIAVQHYVPASRLTKKWFLTRGYWQGVSDVILDQVLIPAKRFSFLKSAITDATELARILTGGYLSPKRTYWHFTNIKFQDWIRFYYILGKIRQKLDYSLHVI